MNTKFSIAVTALVAGLVGGIVGGNFIKPAFAASSAITIAWSNKAPNEVAAKCDFSKSIVALGTVVICMPR